MSKLVGKEVRVSPDVKVGKSEENFRCVKKFSVWGRVRAHPIKAQIFFRNVLTK